MLHTDERNFERIQTGSIIHEFSLVKLDSSKDCCMKKLLLEQYIDRDEIQKKTKEMIDYHNFRTSKNENNFLEIRGERKRFLLRLLAHVVLCVFGSACNTGGKGG